MGGRELTLVLQERKASLDPLNFFGQYSPGTCTCMCSHPPTHTHKLTYNSCTTRHFLWYLLCLKYVHVASQCSLAPCMCMSSVYLYLHVSGFVYVQVHWRVSKCVPKCDLVWVGDEILTSLDVNMQHVIQLHYVTTTTRHSSTRITFVYALLLVTYSLSLSLYSL